MANHLLIHALQALHAFGLKDAPRTLLGTGAVYHIEGPGDGWVLKATRPQGIMPWCRSLKAAGVSVVTPETSIHPNPIPDAFEPSARAWVLYPFVRGRAYEGRPGELEDAGRLLGQIHQHPFDERWGLPLFEGGGVDLPKGLHLVAGSFDFKAANLLVEEEPGQGLMLIDPDNGAILPRIYDLAIAWGTFHLDFDSPLGPLPPLSPAQWNQLLKGYGEHITLTPLERELWPLARQLAFEGEVLWHLDTHRGHWDQVPPALEAAYRGLDLGAYPCIAK